MRKCTKIFAGITAIFMLVLGISACKSEISSVTQEDTTPPGPVTNLQAVAEEGKIILTWEDPEDSDLYAIKIYNGTEVSRAVSLGNGILIGKRIEKYEITNLTDGAVYTFRVSAVDKALNESETVTSNEVTFGEKIKIVTVTEIKYVCPNCSKTYDTASEAADCCGVQTVEVKEVVEKKTYICPTCSKEYETAAEAAECCGSKIETVTKYVCPTCKKEYDTAEAAAECCGTQVETITATVTKYVCPTCKKEYETADDAAACHVVTAASKYICPKCLSEYSTAAEAASCCGVQTEKMFVCPNCSKTYSTASEAADCCGVQTTEVEKIVYTNTLSAGTYTIYHLQQNTTGGKAVSNYTLQDTETDKTVAADTAMDVLKKTYTGFTAKAMAQNETAIYVFYDRNEIKYTFLTGDKGQFSDGVVGMVATGLYGESFTVSDPVSTDYIFMGWATADNKTPGETFGEEDLTFNAKWTKKTGTSEPAAASFYVNEKYTYASFAEVGEGSEPTFVIDGWEGAWIGVNSTDGIAHFSTNSGYYHGATIGQMADETKNGSYYDFSNVANVTFYIKSADEEYNGEMLTALDPGIISLISQYTDGTGQTNVQLTKCIEGSSITDWTKVTLPITRFASTKVKTVCAIGFSDSALSISGDLLIKQVSFTDADGNEVDISENISYPTAEDYANGYVDDDDVANAAPAAVAGFYTNTNYTYSTFTNISKGTEPQFVIDAWEGAWVGINSLDQIAHMGTNTGYFHGVAFGQLPDNAKLGSYYDVTDVENMIFYIKSADGTYNDEAVTGIDYGNMKLYIQYADGTAQTETALSQFLTDAADDWKKATIPAATFASKHLTCVFAIGIEDGSQSISGDIFVKGISFVDASGNEVDDITKNVTYVVADETPTTSPSGYTSFYKNTDYTSGRWENLSYTVKPDFIIDSWEGAWCGVNDETGIATMKILTGNWHGGTFAGLPTNTTAGSYYDFTNVANIRFYIKSSAISTANLKVLMQFLDAEQTEVAISTYGVSDITDWTQVTIPTASLTSKKVTTALALGVAAGSCSVNDTVFVTGMEFLNASGNEIARSELIANLDYKKPVTYTGADSSTASVNSTTNRTQNTTTGAYVYTAANPSDSSSFTTVVWSDEFNGTSVDTTNNWTYEVGTGDWGWGNNEQEYYTNGDNASVANGALQINAKSDLTSTRMKTDGKVNFKYGKISCRMRFDEGAGAWPAFWMLGASLSEGTGWPYCGEIDIMEHANQNGYVNNTLHFNYKGSNPSTDDYAHGEFGTTSKENYWQTIDALDCTQWHVYSVVWTDSKIQMYVDDSMSYECGTSGTGFDCFNKPFYILINFAMGGLYVSNVDSTTFTNLPWNMFVDYVRVYQ